MQRLNDGQIVAIMLRVSRGWGTSLFLSLILPFPLVLYTFPAAPNVPLVVAHIVYDKQPPASPHGT